MAKLQKKKTYTDKVKKKDDASSEVVADQSGVNSSLDDGHASAQVASKSVFKNVKTMTAQTVVEGELNLFQKSVQFLKEVQAELTKVAWPNKKQTAGSTVVVIVLVFIVAAFLGLVDITLSKLVQAVLA